MFHTTPTRSFSSRENQQGQAWVMALEEAIKSELRDVLSRSGLSPNFVPERLSSVVDDSPSVYLVKDKRTPAVLLISPERFPDVISLEHVKAAEMKAYLGCELGSIILDPIALGRSMGRSYALVPLKKRLSDYRMLWSFQRRSIKASLVEWLQEILSAGVIEDSSFRLYETALEAFAGVDALDQRTKHVARVTLDRLVRGEFLPRSTPMHSDLWRGNILLPHDGDQAARRFPFFIIDWRGSRIDGFPFFDLIKLSMSLPLAPPELRREIVNACDILGCGLDDVPGYLAAALGDLSLRLDQFPFQRFLGLTNDCFAELHRAGL
jgi:hypothetical protein